MKSATKTLIFGLCLMGSLYSVCGQEPDFDSLTGRIENLIIESDPSVPQALIRLSQDYFNSNNPEYDLGHLANSWGKYYQSIYQFDSAIKYYQKALDNFQNGSDSLRIAQVLYDLALSYSDIEEYIYSTQLLMMSLEIREQLGTGKEIADVLNKIANNYYYSGDEDIAYSYYVKAWANYEDIGDDDGVLKVLGNLGALFNLEGDNDSALYYYNLARELSDEETNYERRYDITVGLGIVYEETGKLVKAYENYRKAFDIAMEHGSELDKAFAYQNFGYYYLKTKKLDSAEWYADITLEYSARLKNFQLRSNSLEILHEVYFEKQLYRKSYQTLTTLRNELDSVFNITAERQLNALQLQYESERKEKEMAQMDLIMQKQEMQAKESRVIRNTLIGITFGLFIIIILVIRSQKLKERANKALKKKNEEIQSKNDQIQSIEVAKNKWFVNIAHELRTPITLVKGPLEQLGKSDYFEEDDRIFLDIATRNISQLENLTSEILDLSKLQESKLTLSKEITDIAELLTEISESFSEIARKNKIHLTYENDTESQIYLEIDRRKLQKAVNNLMSNAVKFTREDGKVKIRLLENVMSVIVQVSDTGHGIDKKELPFVFDRFYQAANQEGANVGGSGVGLSLSKEIVELHGGEINVTSDLGVGSTFEIRLPASLKIEESELPSLSEGSKRTAGNGKPSIAPKEKIVYLADDNPDMRDYIISFLEDKYLVKSFNDGKEIINELDIAIPDLIICDIMMPRMDGISLAKKLKEREEWRNIPFIIVTAVTDEQQKIMTLRVGIDDYIIKPFNPEELLIRIENLISNQENRESSGVLQPEEVESYQEKLISKLEEEVKNNIADPDFNVIRLAHAGSLSERQLYRYLKQTTGFTPANFVKEIRLQRAFELARRNAYSTTAELAYAVGFQHPNYFVTVFKKRFGKRPSDFLKE